MRKKLVAGHGEIDLVDQEELLSSNEARDLELVIQNPTQEDRQQRYAMQNSSLGLVVVIYSSSVGLSVSDTDAWTDERSGRGEGMVKLHRMVKKCSGYRDIRVMGEMIHSSGNTEQADIWNK